MKSIAHAWLLPASVAETDRADFRATGLGRNPRDSFPSLCGLSPREGRHHKLFDEREQQNSLDRICMHNAP